MSRSQRKFDIKGKAGPIVPACAARTWVKTLAGNANAQGKMRRLPDRPARAMAAACGSGAVESDRRDGPSSAQAS